MRYLSNAVVSPKSPHSFSCPCSTEAVDIAHKPPRTVACSARIVVDRQTDTQNDYCNPRCACAPRVYNYYDSSITIKKKFYKTVAQYQSCTLAVYSYSSPKYHYYNNDRYKKPKCVVHLRKAGRQACAQ